MWENTIRRVEKTYRRRYDLTLALTPENIEKALLAYQAGLWEHKGIVPAITSLYGYRYRRLENFIKECGLWKPEAGWLVPSTLLKIYGEYTDTFPTNVEVYIRHGVPEPLIGQLDTKACRQFFYDVIEELSLIESFYFLGGLRFTVKAGEDCEYRWWRYVFCSHQPYHARVAIWKRGKIVAELAVRGEVQNWYFHGRVPTPEPPLYTMRLEELE